ncbi:MAG: efflux RND transporter periplasmic adaptor subunit [Syntrophobacteraceae bacterium]
MRAAVLKKPTYVLFSIVLALVAGGCEDKNQYVAPPPPSVSVTLPTHKSVAEYIEFTGTTQAIASIDIRARVQGFLQSVHYQDGSPVKKGDLLYIIEPATYQAAVDKAVGELDSKKAQLDRAEVEYQRNLRLMKENATSERDLNNSKATRDSAKADVLVAAANLDTARISLGYTTIRAPLDGRIGRTQIDVGNLVGAGEFTLLTTIKQYNPIYAYFTLNEHDLLRIARMYLGQETVPVPVYLGLADEQDCPHVGTLNYEDLGVDPSTGTFLLRAVFPNPPPYLILPGLFVRLRASVGTHENALMVPERAIGVDQGGKYVLVVDNDDVVRHRPIKVGILDGGLREIEQGLKADERVIVTGLQRARPGVKVVPTAADPAASAASPKRSSASSGQSASPAKP